MAEFFKRMEKKYQIIVISNDSIKQGETIIEDKLKNFGNFII